MNREQSFEYSLFTHNCSLLRAALEAKNMEEIDSLLGELEKMPLDAEERGKIDAVSDLVLIGEYREAVKIADNILRERAGDNHAV
jgi:hypothetical protein